MVLASKISVKEVFTPKKIGEKWPIFWQTYISECFRWMVQTPTRHRQPRRTCAPLTIKTAHGFEPRDLKKGIVGSGWTSKCMISIDCGTHFGRECAMPKSVPMSRWGVVAIGWFSSPCLGKPVQLKTSKTSIRTWQQWRKMQRMYHDFVHSKLLVFSQLFHVKESYHTRCFKKHFP